MTVLPDKAAFSTTYFFLGSVVFYSEAFLFAARISNAEVWESFLLLCRCFLILRHFLVTPDASSTGDSSPESLSGA